VLGPGEFAEFAEAVVRRYVLQQPRLEESDSSASPASEIVVA
jgi:hypothetical protein